MTGAGRIVTTDMLGSPQEEIDESLDVAGAFILASYALLG
jgi:hypothetical protein